MLVSGNPYSLMFYAQFDYPDIMHFHESERRAKAYKLKIVFLKELNIIRH